MKTQNKSSIITGVLLLLLSALFSISLILQPFDFGVMGPGKNNIFYFLGKMLYSVYGFSSILIPAFLMIAGLSCFSTKWTARKTMRLLTALIPFFTCVITENICRSILTYSGASFSSIKLIVTLVIGAMLMVIEFLGIGIIADKIQHRKYGSEKKSKISRMKISGGQMPSDFEDEKNLDDENSENSVQNSENLKINPIFDEALENVTFDDKSGVNFDEESENPDNNTTETAAIETSSENKNKIGTFSENKTETSDENTKSFDDDDEENRARASMITQEEFAALTAPDSAGSEDFENDGNGADELEWNLPPQPETLPPEYDADFESEIDENDEALEFPPKDEPNATEINSMEKSDFSENENSFANSAHSAVSDENSDETLEFENAENFGAGIINVDSDFESETSCDENSFDEDSASKFSKKTVFTEENSDVENSDSELEELSEEEFGFGDEEILSENQNTEPETSTQNQTENLHEEASGNSENLEYSETSTQNPSYENQNQNSYNEYNYFDMRKNSVQLQKNQDDNPYAAARYIDKVVNKNAKPQSQFPHGIVIHDGSEEQEEESESQPEVPRSQFPTRINLDETLVSESFADDSDDFADDFVEDETLPFPDFDIEEPAIYGKDNQKKNYSQNSDENGEIETLCDADFDTESDEIESSTIFDEDYDENSDEGDSVNPKNSVENIALVSQAAQQAANSARTQVFQEKEERTGNVSQNLNLEKGGITESASDVFSDMEAEIRRYFEEKNAEKMQENQNPHNLEKSHVSENLEISDNLENTEELENTENLENAENFQVGFDGNQIEKETSPNLERESARNLTADELSDFFNAQQAENTPKGTEILANPVQIGNRATKKGAYVIPSDLLIAYKDDEYWVIDDATKEASLTLKRTLAEFNIEADIIGIKKGPVVTMFELLPAPGVKLRKIVALQDNIALNLAAQSVRIVAPIPGKQAVGIEVPNRHRSVVGFREIIEMNLPEWQKMAVPVVLGKDILGKAQLIDLVKTPHMLIAGATGSGKSVCVNSLILSILYKRSFRDVKLILVDPKVVELKLYNNIPHLLTPVITEPKKALQALKWALCEMERRYALLDQLAVRDISTYNQRIKEQNICTEKMPYIIIIIDEFADLMATSGKELETVIARLTAMSRAVGIHLVLATQRPAVNVITGLIKANIPTRIAFMVASRTDSGIIIDTVGAEKLLGRGDMLYSSAVDPAPIRIQGTFVTDQEVEDVVRTVKEYGEPDYIDDEIFFDDDDDDSARDLFGEPMDDDDPLYDQALEIVVQAGKASASYIQRKLKIGYNRAARLVEEMEERGIVGPANGSKPREIIHIP